MDNQQFKIHYQDEIRRVAVPSIEWKPFLDLLCQVFGPKFNPTKVAVMYKDDENDMVHIASEPEWREALSILADQRIKHIYLCPRKKNVPVPTIANPNSPCNNNNTSSNSDQKEEKSPKNISLPTTSDIKDSLNKLISEVERLTPQILAGGASVGSDVQQSLSKLLAEVNRLVPLLVNDGTQNMKNVANDIMQKINFFGPMILSTGLPLAKSWLQNIVGQIDVQSSAKQISTQIVSSLNQLASYLLQHQRNYEAKCVLEVLLQRDPSNTTALINLARVHHRLNEDTSAIATLSQAVSNGAEIGNDLELAHLLRDGFNNASKASQQSGVIPKKEDSPQVEAPIVESAPIANPPQIVEEKKSQPKVDYSVQLSALESMGFLDSEHNLELLISEDGNISAVVGILLNN